METAVALSTSPFFIAGDATRTLAFFGALGIEMTFQEPASNPFFAILVRERLHAR